MSLDTEFRTIFDTLTSTLIRSFFVRDASDVVLDPMSGKVSSILDRSAAPMDATQADDAKRPAYHATGLFGGPSLHFTGGQVLSAPAFDVSAYQSLAMIVLGQSDQEYTGYFCAHSTGTEGVSLRCHAGLQPTGPSTPNEIAMRARVGNLISEVRSDAIYPMTSPGVLTGTWDKDLQVEETHLYHGLDLVDHHRLVDDDTSGTWQPKTFHIGAANKTPTRDLRGHIAAIVYVGFQGPPDLVRLGAAVGLLSDWRGMM